MATLDLVSAGETNWATQQNANLTALNTELIATTAKANAAQVAADLDDDTAALAADSESALRTELNAAYVTWENALKWGADPTGATYSDAAIEALLSSFTDRGVAVYFPRGTYKFAAPIIVGNATKLIGAGGLMLSQVNSAANVLAGGPESMTYRPETVLSFPDGTDGIVTPNSTDYNFRAHGIEISFLTIAGSDDQAATRGVWFRKNQANEDANHIYGKVGLSGLTNVYIEGFGTGFDGDETCDSCYLHRVHIHDCGYGVKDGDSEFEMTRSCVWSITTGEGVTVNGDRGFFANNEIEPGISRDGIKVYGADNKIIGNDFKDSATALVLWGPRNTAQGNTFSRGIQNHAILVGRSNGAQAANDCSVVGNTIHQFGGVVAGGIDAIVVYGGADRAVIVGNTVSDPGAFALTASSPPARAVRLRTATSGTPVAPTGCIVANNSAHDLTDPWSDDGLGNSWNGNLPLDPYNITGGDGSRLISGKYVMPAYSRNPTNLAIANETMFAVPVVFRNEGTIDALGIYVGTAGQSGAKIRLGMYLDNGSGCYPGALVVDGGQVSADSTGVKTISVSVPVKAGVYWVVAVAQSAPSTQPSVNCALSLYPRVMASNAFDALQGNARCYQQTGVSGALPATFVSTPATGIRDVMVGVRVA